MNETPLLLADMVDRLFTDHVTPSLLASVEAGQWPQSLWSLVEEQGLTRPLVPEERGGMAATWHDAYVILRAVGRHCVPLPLPETIAASWLLALAGLEPPDGPATLAVVGPASPLTIAGSAQDRRLIGVLRHVPWGRAVETIVTLIREGDGTLVVKIPRREAAVRPGINLAGEFRDTLSFNDHPVEISPIPLAWDSNNIETIGALLRSAQMGGALSDLVERSAGYAQERQQFGRPISKYQAIQHHLAVLAAEAAAAEVAAEAAFLAADQGDPSFPIAVAKVRAGQAVAHAVGLAHQIHGAIGFTMEHPLQWRTRRLLSWRTEFGGDRQWAVFIGERVLEWGADGFWPRLTTL